MAIYRVKVEGRSEPILLRASGKPEALATIVTEAKALTSDEVEEALAAGDKVWKPGEPLSVDVPADVRRLVIAARAALLQYGDDMDETRELSASLEAFVAQFAAE